MNGESKVEHLLRLYGGLCFGIGVGVGMFLCYVALTYGTHAPAC